MSQERMPKCWIEYTDEYYASSLSSEVHRPLDCEYWNGATEFDPPLPKMESKKGYKRFKIEVRGYILVFSSIQEINR